MVFYVPMKSKHEQRFDEIKKQEEASRTFYNQETEIFDILQASDTSSQIFGTVVCSRFSASGDNPIVVDMFLGAQPIKRIDRES